ncbi:MAG TPA: class I tRNA ligase family protein, partial [Gemmatimonadaceae bacterium]
RAMRGAELAGVRYERPLDWVPITEGDHGVIVAEDFVSAEDGSGVVHMAPAFGADDYAAGRRNGLAFLQPVDAAGRFNPEVPVVGGAWVKDADSKIIEELRAAGVLWKASTVEHSYPHCWRCSTPLLYYARTSWFVRTTGFREQMLARNARVNWNPPEVGEGRFGEWLSNNIDWAISRDRYWGTPLPLWICDAEQSHREAIGSYAQLAERTGAALGPDFDPHKPYVDAYTWPCRSCAGTMRRVSEVIDTWFDSGSMPFAQWHFPFENSDRLADQYPADFIAEGVDQTRGWFYSLLAIATGLGDALPNNVLNHDRGDGVNTAPYRAVVVNDLLLDAEGQKMSKSRGNVVDPWMLMERHGADAVRLSLLAVSQVWIPRRFDESVIREHAGRFIVTLKNVYSGIFALYANFGWEPSAADPPPAGRPLIDRWILSRLRSVELEVNGRLEGYDATLAARAVTAFVVDDVANWYIRLNRHRFYEVTEADNRAAFATLHEVLAVTCRLLAPFAPFVSDWIHRELTGGSVHLASFVRASAAPADPLLESGMDAARKLATLARAAREEAGVRVRQPLSRMVCVVPEGMRDAVQPLTELLASELNVKHVELATSSDALVRLEAKANFRTLGKRFGKSTPQAAAAVAGLDSDALRALERGEPVFITVEGEAHALSLEEVTIIRRAAGELVVAEEGEYFAAVDPAVSGELREEGLARELVSRVQRLRKESGFAVSDRIALGVWGDPEVESAARAFGAWISEEVLARELVVGERRETDNPVYEVVLDGRTVAIAVRRLE